MGDGATTVSPACREALVMSLPGIVQYFVFLVLVTLLVKSVGGCLACVFSGEKTLLDVR
jgi:hypothetical protein